MKYALSLFISVCFIKACHGQEGEFGYLPGYIVTNQDDTVKGFLKNRSATRNLLYVRFKKTEKDKEEDYSPTQLKGFQIGVHI